MSNSDNVSFGNSNQQDLKTCNKEDVTTSLEFSKKRFRRRVWVSVSMCCILYVVSFLSVGSITIQYFSIRIAEDKYHITYNQSNEKCSNASNKLEGLLDRVQKEASQVMLESGLVSGVPACFTSILVGSYSDYIGRKPILVASLVGGFVRLFLLTLIVKFHWNIRLYYVGAAIDGMLGSYFTLILATTAIITDITPKAENRALNFAAIEGLMLPTAAAAQIGIGYLIKNEGFLMPTTILCCLLALALLCNFTLLPETMQWKRTFTWNPKLHIGKVVGFYYFTSRKKRNLYILGLGAFVVVALTNIGRQNVETLFQLNYPLCWNPVEIGIYTAFRILGTALITVVFLKLMKNRLSLEFTGVICALSGIAGFIMFGLSRTSPELYLAALVGGLYLGCIPIPRALLSQLTSPTEQGALFSSLSVVDAISSLVSSTLFTLIYNATINSFKGTVFMIIASFTFINVAFLIAFRLVRANSVLSDYVNLVEPEAGAEKPQENGISRSGEDTIVDESAYLLVK